MKRVIIQSEIENTFNTLGWVDFFVINKITDTQLFLTVFTKYKIEKEDKEFDTLVESLIQLGDTLNKEVVWSYSTQYGSKIKRFIRKRLLRRKQCRNQQK